MPFTSKEIVYETGKVAVLQDRADGEVNANMCKLSGSEP